MSLRNSLTWLGFSTLIKINKQRSGARMRRHNGCYVSKSESAPIQLERAGDLRGSRGTAEG